MILVNACENIRDQLLLKLLYESSLRVGECLALWIEDVDVDGRKIHVRDRGELANDAEIKTEACCRSVDVSADLINQILDYLVIVHTDEVETNHLFVKLRGLRAGKPLEYADVNDLFQRLKAKTGIDAHAHLLRHSFLTSLAKNGMRPEVLRERAGHAQFQYTYQLYVHPSEEDMREEWERVKAQSHPGHPAEGGYVECHHCIPSPHHLCGLILLRRNLLRMFGMFGRFRVSALLNTEVITFSISCLSP